MSQQLIQTLDKATMKNLNRSGAETIPETGTRKGQETPLAIAERWQGYFSGRTFSDSTELIRKQRQG